MVAVSHPASPGQIAIAGLQVLLLAVGALAVGWWTERSVRKRYTYTGSMSNLWYGVPEPRELEMDPVPRWFRPVYVGFAALVVVGSLITLLVALIRAVV
jgi:hypothetical protein